MAPTAPRDHSATVGRVRGRGTGGGSDDLSGAVNTGLGSDVAKLHVLGDWHGPGEEKAARRLAAELPGGWDIVAGRDVPSGMGTVDIDLIVVSPRAVYVLEEKSWGPHVVAGEVAWYVSGERRHNPNSQVQHAVRVLAGRIKAGCRAGGTRSGSSRTVIASSAVTSLMSHDNLAIQGADELGEDVVLRLDDTAATLSGSIRAARRRCATAASS